MKTDSFFYRFFSEFPSAFFLLLGEDGQKAKRYHFSSVEVKEQAFRIDAVFLPDSDEDDIYFVEVQFHKDQKLYSRLLAEIYLYLRQDDSDKDWRAVVIFPEEEMDPGVYRRGREFFEGGRLRCIYLNQLPREDLEKFPLNLLQIILNSKQNAVATAQKIVRQLPSEIVNAGEQQKIMELLVGLVMSKLPQFSIMEIRKMVEPMLSDIKKSRAYQEIAEEGAREEKREIAKAMLKKKMNLKLVAELTGLPQKEVRALSAELAGRKN